jgi:hypothetical protein
VIPLWEVHALIALITVAALTSLLVIARRIDRQ